MFLLEHELSSLPPLHQAVGGADPDAPLRLLADGVELDARADTSYGPYDAAKRDLSPLMVAAGSTRGSAQTVDALLLARIKHLIEAFPTYGYRRICALLRKRDKLIVNRKKVYRLMRAQRWMTSQRETSPKPRVQQSHSRTEHSNERWAMDIAHVSCGADGWGYLVAVIDCEACSFYRLDQEYIMPYTPEQNGLIERFFRSFKEECVWQPNFTSFAEARQAVQAWLEWYNRERPHQALGYLSPHEYRAQEPPPASDPPNPYSRY